MDEFDTRNISEDESLQGRSKRKTIRRGALGIAALCTDLEWKLESSSTFGPPSNFPYTSNILIQHRN